MSPIINSWFRRLVPGGCYCFLIEFLRLCASCESLPNVSGHTAGTYRACCSAEPMLEGLKETRTLGVNGRRHIFSFSHLGDRRLKCLYYTHEKVQYYCLTNGSRFDGVHPAGDCTNLNILAESHKKLIIIWHLPIP